MKHVKTLVITLALAAVPTAFAAGSMDGMNMKGMDMKPSAASQMAPQPVAAEVKNIDAKAGKITLKHGPIENLGMPAMVMAFPVKDRASLTNFKDGDAVSVTFDKVSGARTVVDMQRR